MRLRRKIKLCAPIGVQWSIPPRDLHGQCPTCNEPVDKVGVDHDRVVALLDPCGHEFTLAEMAAWV